MLAALGPIEPVDDDYRLVRGIESGSMKGL